MKLEEVQELWSQDSKIHKDDIALMDRDTLSGGSLVSKYMNILTLEKRRAFRLENKRMQLQMWLEGYYKDNLYCDELERKPSPKLAKTNDEAKRMAVLDKTMVKLQEMIIESESIVLLCMDAIKYISYNRTKDIRNFIDWTKWHHGQL